MVNNKDKQKSLKQALREIDKIFVETVNKLENLHQQKMALIKKYQESSRENEIEKIRKSLKNT